MGETRHFSGGGGEVYGEKAKNDDVIKMLIDTSEGSLSFVQNEVHRGVAF